MKPPVHVRCQHAWAVLSGKIILPASIEELQVMADLSATAAAVAALSVSADRLIALNSSNAAALATAQSDLANADATISAEVASITSKIDAAAPVTTVSAPVSDATTLTLDTPAPAAA